MSVGGCSTSDASTSGAAPRRSRVASLLAAAVALGMIVASAADGGTRRPPHHPPPGGPPASPPSGPGAPPGGDGHDNGHPQSPPTTPNPGNPPGGWVAKRLEAMAIVDQFPPAVVVEFEGLLMGWIEFNGSNDSRYPFDEWLWANGVEDPEEFAIFMLIFQLIFALR